MLANIHLDTRGGNMHPQWSAISFTTCGGHEVCTCGELWRLMDYQNNAGPHSGAAFVAWCFASTFHGIYACSWVSSIVSFFPSLFIVPVLGLLDGLVRLASWVSPASPRSCIFRKLSSRGQCFFVISEHTLTLETQLYYFAIVSVDDKSVLTHSQILPRSRMSSSGSCGSCTSRRKGHPWRSGILLWAFSKYSGGFNGTFVSG